jgi:HPt (histidine-containing phosphotransfer) domain-containing protein
MPSSAGPKSGVENRQQIEARIRALVEETDPEFTLQIIEEFRSAAPPMLRELREALARPDSTVAGRIAHSLKSNCATFGLIRLASQLQALELACKDHPPPPVSAVEQVVAVYRAAEALLAEATQSVLGPQ